MSAVVDLGEGIYQLDIYETGVPGRTCAYLVKGSKTALIETGAAPWTGNLLSALKLVDVALSEIDYVIVTHIHLDHAGGAGVLLQKLPNAQLVVHPRGARHMVDPSRLMAGVRAVYNQYYDEFFGQVAPVEEERVYTPADGGQLNLGNGRLLTFHYTLGHAPHHMVIYDPVTRGLFSGDALGILYSSLSEIIGYEYIFPITPPPDFDPGKAVAACEQIERLVPEVIYFTHFGRSFNVSAVLARNRETLEKLAAAGRRVLAAGGSVKNVEEKVWELIEAELSGHDPADYRRLIPELNVKLCVEGIVDYLKKQNKG